MAINHCDCYQLVGTTYLTEFTPFFSKHYWHNNTLIYHKVSIFESKSEVLSIFYCELRYNNTRVGIKPERYIRSLPTKSSFHIAFTKVCTISSFDGLLDIMSLDKPSRSKVSRYGFCDNKYGVPNCVYKYHATL